MNAIDRAILRRAGGVTTTRIGLTSALIPTYDMMGAATALLLFRAITAAIVIWIAARVVLRRRPAAAVAE